VVSEIEDAAFGPVIKAAPLTGGFHTGTTNPNATNNFMSSFGPSPELTGGMLFSEVGNSGLRAFSGWIREEILPELTGRQGAQKYREMGDNSPIIGAVLFAIKSTMRKVEWRVVPCEDSQSGPAQEAADFVQSLMDDMSETWEDLVVENLSALQYGYAFHEIVYKRRLGKKPPKSANNDAPASSDYDDGMIGWRRIPIRGQDTILKWFFDNFGTITGVTQLPWTGTMRDIAMEKGLLFRPDQFKNNPEGRSILRSAYIPYYFAKRLQEQEAIMGERMGGVPVVSVPLSMIEAANAGNAKAVASMTAFKNLAVNLRIDEQMGVVMPSDPWQGSNGPTPQRQYSLELITPTGGRGGTMNFESAIVRYNTNIMTSVLADFLTLGHEARGTQSLAVTKVDLFFQAIEGYLNSNAAIYNRYALPRIWELNALDPDVMPTIEPDLAQRVDLDVLSNFVLRLSQSGMPLFPNDDLQTFLLDAGGLPDVSDPRALQAAGLLDEQLEMQDDKDQASLEAMVNPQPPKATPQPGGGAPRSSSNLEKMLLGSLARRMIKQAGPRFGVNTRKRQRSKRNART
jgi:hypothetical protein